MANKLSKFLYQLLMTLRSSKFILEHSDILNGKRADDFEYTLGQIKKGDFVVVKFLG